MENSMIEILTKTSTNGRWGLKIVAEQEIDLSSPQEGTMHKIKNPSQFDIYQFTSQKTGVFFIVGEDIQPLTGAKVVADVSLQSSKSVQIIAGKSIFGIMKYTYKRRSSKMHFFNNGEKVELPDSVLYAMGLVEGVEKEEIIIDDIPEPDNAFSAFFNV